MAYNNTLKVAWEGENGKIVCRTMENASICVYLLFPEFWKNIDREASCIQLDPPRRSHLLPHRFEISECYGYWSKQRTLKFPANLWSQNTNNTSIILWALWSLICTATVPTQDHACCNTEKLSEIVPLGFGILEKGSLTFHFQRNMTAINVLRTGNYDRKKHCGFFVLRAP